MPDLKLAFSEVEYGPLTRLYNAIYKEIQCAYEQDVLLASTVGVLDMIKHEILAEWVK